MITSIGPRARRVALLALLICAMIYVGVRIVGRSLRYSVYYVGPTVEDVVRDEKMRQDAAERWAASFQWRIPPVHADDAPRLVCIAFMTAPRGGAPSRYAAHALRSIFESLTDLESQMLYTVARVQGPSPCPRVLDRFHVQLRTQATQLTLADERADYLAVLNECVRHGSPYILVLEGPFSLRGASLPHNFADDIWSCKHLVFRVLRAVRLADVQSRRSWAILKVFMHEYWQGWDNVYGVRLAVFATLCSLSALGATVWLLRRRRGGALLATVLVAMVVTAAVAFVTGWAPYALGRQHVWPPFWRGLNKYYPSATVAMLYNNTQAGAMQSLMAHVKSSQEPIDLAIDDWLLRADVRGRGFVHTPSLVQHVGLLSSIEGKSAMPLWIRLEEFKQSLHWSEDE